MKKEFTEEQYALVKKMLGKWGRNITGLKLYWKPMWPTITLKTKIGYHSVFHRKTIFINKKFQLVPENLLDTIAHEKIHSDQHEYYGTFGYMVRAIFRHWTLEPPAELEEDAVLMLMSKSKEVEKQ